MHVIAHNNNNEKKHVINLLCTLCINISQNIAVHRKTASSGKKIHYFRTKSVLAKSII